LILAYRRDGSGRLPFMAKRGRRPHDRRHQSGRDKRRRQARPGRTHRHGPTDLLVDAGQRLASGEPLDFLAYVSTLLAAIDPRGQNPFELERPGGPERVTLPMLLESFAEVALPETTALLAALAELGPDELTRARARRALATRSYPLPDWLGRLGDASVYRAVESTHVLGDGVNVLLGARLSDHELTAAIYIDHNLGTVVKDGFPAPSPIGDVVAHMRKATDDPDVTFADIALADARARVAEAIEVGAIMFPPFETDTRPASRPLTEWLLRLLPEGGTGYVRPKWSKAAKNGGRSRKASPLAPTSTASSPQPEPNPPSSGRTTRPSCAGTCSRIFRPREWRISPTERRAGASSARPRPAPGTACKPAWKYARLVGLPR